MTKHDQSGPQQLLRQDWAEALKGNHEQYTSVDLQHRAVGLLNLDAPADFATNVDQYLYGETHNHPA